MKIHTHQNHFRPLTVAVIFCLAFVSLAHAQTGTPAPIKMSGAAKVRVIVTENLGGSGPGGLTAGTATPAPAPVPGAAPKAGEKAPTGAGIGKAEAVASEMKSYTHTSNKSFKITVVNLTAASMDVNVKTAVLGKDEVGKHEVVTEKTLENKLTLLPNTPNSFTTEDVTFTHTTAHRGVQPSKPGGGGGGKNAKIAPMEPASGHAYFGYKVEVFQGNDLVGVTASETH